MSLLFKRPNSPFWYVTKTRQSTHTINRKHAEEYARKALHELWRQDSLGEVTHSWASLCEEWLEVKASAASLSQDKMVIERFTALLDRKSITYIADIKADTVMEYGRVLKASQSPATVNRHYTTIRAMLNHARTQGHLANVPFIRNYKLPTKEPKWITLAQFDTILPHLPDWVKNMAIVAVQTGMRYSNVAGLRWEWVNSDMSAIQVPAIYAKTGRTYTVPINEKVKLILLKLKENQGLSPFPAFVFIGYRRTAVRDGQGGPSAAKRGLEAIAPTPSIRHWWERATELAGFQGLRWHDLRHTWASLMTQNGVPDRILKELGGWSSTRMLDNYSHLALKHLTAYADHINAA